MHEWHMIFWWAVILAIGVPIARARQRFVAKWERELFFERVRKPNRGNK